MKRFITVLALVPVVALLGGCGGGEKADEPAPAAAATATPAQTRTPEATPPPKGDTKRVAIEGFAFGPGTVKVKAGDTIEWTNDDAAPHTVTAKSGGDLDSGTMAQGASFEFTAAQPGTIAYFCAIHPSMTGTIEVS
jgi:plastocyanin